MGILNWLFGKLDDTNTIAEQADTIAKLQQEVDALRRQEVMNLGNREEINRLHRQINDMKYGPTVKQQMAEMTYDELLEEAKRRRLLKHEVTKPVHREAKPYHGRTAPTRVRTSTAQSPSSASSGAAYLAAGIAIGSATLASSASNSCSTSSDSGSSSSSSDGGSCDSGGGF